MTRLITPLFWSGLAVSLASGLAGMSLLALEPAAFAGHWFRQGTLLAALHLCTLGFVGVLVIGVLTQFLPMLLGRRLGPSLASGAGLGLFGLGALLLVGVFAGWRSAGPALIAGLSLLLVSAWILALAWPALVHGGSRQRLSRATLTSALAYLVLTAGLGTLMAQGLVGAPRVSVNPLDLLRIHAHLGLLGFAGLAIFAVSYELLPMFNLAKGYALWPGWTALGLVHAGLLLLAAACLGFLSPLGSWALAAECLLGLASLAYLGQMAWIQARAFRKADASVWLFRQAGAALLAVALAAPILAWRTEAPPGAVSAAAFAMLFGFLGGAIFSQLQKIVPLMSWVDRFSGYSGRAKVPTAHQLMSRPLAWLALPLHGTALVAGCWGLAASAPDLVRLAGCLGALLFLNQALLVLVCRVRGRVEPLASPGAVPTAAPTGA